MYVLVVQGLENEKKALVEEYSAALSNSDLKVTKKYGK